MADQKVSALDAIEAATADDLLYLVDGAAASKKITFANVEASIDHTNIVAGDGSDHANVATNTADIATNVTAIGLNTADRHAEIHDIASHSDTSATGAELDTLTDNSIANTLHRHSELVASDGAPDPALSIDANGNVGIGTTSPAAELDFGNSLNGDVDGVLFYKSGNVKHGLKIGGYDSYHYFPSDIAGSYDIGTMSTEDGTTYSSKFTILTSGNVGIGVNDPDAKLEVAGDVHISNSGDLIIGSTTLTEAQLIALLALLE